jgi:hypothetical protein
LPSVQEHNQDWEAPEGLWVLAGSRRERLEVVHTVPVEALGERRTGQEDQVAPRIVLVEVVDHTHAGELYSPSVMKLGV